jgi:hypothetical protein
MKSGEASHALYAEGWKHPLGQWHHAALVYDGHEMRHYVNGVQELAHKMPYSPTRGGQTSIGVRMNRVSWFRGAIQAFCFTPRVLAPAEFMG